MPYAWLNWPACRTVAGQPSATESGGLPAWARMLDKAIEKQAAWAAPMSCSGFEPVAVSAAVTSAQSGLGARQRLPGLLDS